MSQLDVGHQHASPAATHGRVVWGIVAAVAIYLGALLAGWPQQGARMIAAPGDAAVDSPLTHDSVPGVAATDEPLIQAGVDAAGQELPLDPPPPWTVAPFVLLLACIAIFPLVPAMAPWWESNSSRFKVALFLGGATLAYYLCLHPAPVERHFLGHALESPAAAGPSFGLAWVVLQNAIFNEYVPFIVLLFSLYTISGGIRIEGDLRAHPLVNAAFIAVGGVLASLIGTTGAAMLMIRPLLETNSERKHVAHTVIFFIFVVCNCGGCLTPLGDPPLFLGYLQGVDFLWTLKLWPAWLLVNGLLLAVYYLWDHFLAYPHETRLDIDRDERLVTSLRFSGVGLGSVLLASLILSVALFDPTKPLPGTSWHPWLYLREVVQLSLVAVSLAAGSSQVRIANRFNYAAIVEVAALFLGIFICMQPALQILEIRGPELGIDTPRKFFWASGTLSSVLDNAPTYLIFFETARALGSAGAPTVAGVAESHLAAISIGSVFMGAMTYIGNGPNFMVKAIAESSNVRMPGFFGYLLYSCGILLPILFLATLVCL